MDFFGIFTLLISLLALMISLRTEWHKRLNLSVTFLEDKICECQVDRTSHVLPDPYFQDKFRLILTFVITNNSSLPTTVINFSLDNDSFFDMYTDTADEYKITLVSPYQEIAPGISAYTGQKKSLTYQINKYNCLKPPFTIKPYESKIGSIVFHYDTSKIGKHRLFIKTSRGLKQLDIFVSSQLISKLHTDYSPPQIDKYF